MKTILAYVLLIFGAPIAIGELSSLLILLILQPIIGESAKKIPGAVLEAVNGITSVTAAVIMFNLLGLKATIIIPVVLSIVCYFWLRTRKESHAIKWHIAGYAIAWIVYIAHNKSLQ